jgi:uncharacterized coiled-coil protein SlyX
VSELEAQISALEIALAQHSAAVADLKKKLSETTPTAEQIARIQAVVAALAGMIG